MHNKSNKMIHASSRLRSASASTQTDQRLCCQNEEPMNPYLPIEHTRKTDLIELMSSPMNIKKTCSTQKSMKFILLINVKMPTIVGILTFISMINTTFETWESKKLLYIQYFSFYKHLKYHAQLIEHEKSFYNLWTGLILHQLTCCSCDSLAQ